MRAKASLINLLVFLTFATAVSAAAPAKNTCSAWADEFSGTALNPNLWVIASGQAPGYVPGVHIGYYVPANVSVKDGFLKLTLNQSAGTVDGKLGVISSGALIYSKAKCGYGTYEWTMRMSSTASTPTVSGVAISGSVSAGFNYVNNSQTEIDFEFSALTNDWLWMVNWLNVGRKTAPTSNEETASYLQNFYPSSAIHIYKYVWAPGIITFYVDGVQRTFHTTNVPGAAAYIMINHWGTNSSGWGGPASIGIGTTRYFYIDRFSYTPLP